MASASLKDSVLKEAKQKKWPAALISGLALCATVVCALLIPDSFTLKSAIISILSSLFCAFVVLLVLDLRTLESRISRLDNEAAIDYYLDMLKADRSTLDHFDEEKLKGLATTTIMSLCKLSDTAVKSDAQELVKLCLDEMTARVSGVYSKNVSVTRRILPHVAEGSDEIVSWLSIQDTSATLVNASSEPKDVPSVASVASGPIKGNPDYARVRKLKRYEVVYNNEPVYYGDEKELEPIECSIDDSGNRIWEINYPANDEIPKQLKPGDSITFRMQEEFYIPPREEVKLRWSYPRKGILYTVKTEGIDDVVPRLSLTGCSLCDGGKRHHRCDSCDKSNGNVSIDNHSTIKVMTDWAGSELGVNIEWEEKEEALAKEN